MNESNSTTGIRSLWYMVRLPYPEALSNTLETYVITNLLIFNFKLLTFFSIFRYSFEMVQDKIDLSKNRHIAISYFFLWVDAFKSEHTVNEEEEKLNDIIALTGIHQERLTRSLPYQGYSHIAHCCRAVQVGSSSFLLENA